MRCMVCGWKVGAAACPCGASVAGGEGGAGTGGVNMVPVGARVLARAGQGPTMMRWERGEVQGHVGRVHRVQTVSLGVFWCEVDDLLADSSRREELLVPGTRVWVLWLDGRWYPGTVDGAEGILRHVAWDDGDRTWIESTNLVVMAVHSRAPSPGERVLAPRWDGRCEPALVEAEEAGRCRVTFEDGEEAWVSAGDLHTFPPSPFCDQP